MKKSLLVLTAALVMGLASCGNKAEEGYKFTTWNDCTALTNLKTLVSKVTKQGASTYVAPADRVAVFDMDGTLYAELDPTYFEYAMFMHRCFDDPTYTAPADVMAVANEIKEGSWTHTYASGMDLRHANAAAKAYAGMTLKEFADYTKEFSKKDAPGFSGMTYAEAFYKPMIEVVDYLHKNDFKCYVVSGSDRFICRALCCDTLKIPSERIIGMDVRLKGTEQGDKDGLDYNLGKSDDLIRTDELLIKNLKMNKVTAIAKEIGRQPIISFGNTGGDTAMGRYALHNNDKPSGVWMLVADDIDRDHANLERAENSRKTWVEEGFNPISMKNDFKTIYGENVKKTDFVIK